MSEFKKWFKARARNPDRITLEEAFEAGARSQCVPDDAFRRAVMEIKDVGYGAIFKHLICERVAELAAAVEDSCAQAQPAPSVPDKVEVREDKEGEIFSRGSYNEGYDNGWNDCIDAMLAAAPERNT